MEQPNQQGKPADEDEVRRFITSVRDNPIATAEQREDAKDVALWAFLDNLFAEDDPQSGESPLLAGTQDQALVKRMQQIADRPVSFQDRLKDMKEFYETNSFHQDRPVEPLEIPADED